MSSRKSAKPKPSGDAVCRLCREVERDHVTLYDSDGEEYRICPGSLEDNTFDPDDD
ncbi:MAG: hypothetical protein M3P30_02355 [Chloroflexota bacterium]|nr:hypothetical protein [Chloroflexota bacterium]